MIFYSFYYFSFLSLHPYISFFLLFFLLHTHPHSSNIVFIFLELFLHTTCPLYFYFSFFISSSLFLILFSHILTQSHTHYRRRTKQEFKAMMLEMAMAEFKACFAQEKCEQETLQCSLLIEKHCSNS